MNALVRMFVLACAIRPRTMAAPAAVLLFAAIGALAAEPKDLHTRSGARTATGTNKVEVVEKRVQLDSTQAAALICDIKKRIALIIGENEYSTWETLPEFARQELVPRGYQISTVSDETFMNGFMPRGRSPSWAKFMDSPTRRGCGQPKNKYFGTPKANPTPPAGQAAGHHAPRLRLADSVGWNSNKKSCLALIKT